MGWQVATSQKEFVFILVDSKSHNSEICPKELTQWETDDLWIFRLFGWKKVLEYLLPLERSLDAIPVLSSEHERGILQMNLIVTSSRSLLMYATLALLFIRTGVHPLLLSLTWHRVCPVVAVLCTVLYNSYMEQWIPWDNEATGNVTQIWNVL